MRKLLLVSMLLTLSACSTTSLFGDKSIANCYKSYAMTNKAIEVGYVTVVKLHTEDLISDEGLTKSINSLDKASQVADSASSLCNLDIEAAFEQFKAVDIILNTLGVNANE